MKKKITLLLLGLVCALCCAVGLAACNNGGNNDNGGNNGDNSNDGSKYLAFRLKDDDTYAASIDDSKITIEEESDGNIITLKAEIPQLTIPAVYNGKAVTEIKAFSDYRFASISIASITIPNSITSIGQGAFEQCNFTSITIPDSVTSIGKYAFEASNLGSITLCNGLTRIEDGAFSYCKLESLKIPDSVVYIGSSIFGDGGNGYESSLTSLELPDNSTHYETLAFQSCGKLTDLTLNSFDALKMDLYSFRQIFGGVPTNLKTITFRSGEAYAIYQAGEEQWDSFCPNLETVILQDGVTSIKQNAFVGCMKLKNVTITNKDTTIATGAFEGCPIETATIPTSAISYIKNAALKNVKITNSDGLTATAFDGCDNMVYNEYDNACYLGSADNQYAYLIKAKDKTIMSCNIHENTEFIANSAFSGCAGIESLTIPSKVTTIGNNSLRSCNFLAVYCEVAAKPEKWDDEWNKCDNDYSYPVIWNCKNNDKDINGYSYAVIDNLRYALKDSTATVVRQPAYLQTATIPATVSHDGTTYNVTAIGNNAFYGCALLTSLTIADSVKSIGNYAFFHCAFTGITLPNELTNIGDCAFQYCESLTNITIPGTVKTIGKGAFGFCNKLESVTIPSGVENIGEITFYACTSLTEITIPESVTEIGAYAFSGCSALTTITFNGTTTQWSAITKGDSWNAATGNYTIHCNGGDIAKEI